MLNAANAWVEPSLLGFLPGIGMPELVVMAIIVLLLFGNRLPGVMRSLGQSITEFKKGTRDGADDSDTKSNLP
jgi:sec-independent protein translocase protein TatA